MPEDVQKKLLQVEKNTAANDTMTMVVALSYSARWELTKAMQDIATDILKQAGDKDTESLVQNINEQTISDHLNTNFMPDPDLLIRTGGELRVSNYLLWQIAYTELYFTNVYWPDFCEKDLHNAILSYQNRQRRFGKTGEQVKKEMQDENEYYK